MDEYLLKKIFKVKTYKNIKKVILDNFIERDIKPDPSIKINILILNAPCMGFGDIVFAMKLYNYLNEWYNCDIKILTTQPQSFISLGFRDDILLKLQAGKRKEQCRRFSELVLYDKNTKKFIKNVNFDVIFVAPVTSDFEPNLAEVKSLIPQANYMNTYFFSEYNDSVDKEFDFPTGVGADRLGMLFTYKQGDIYSKPNYLPDKYSMMYISDNDEHAVECYESFLEMLTNIYKYDRLDIIASDWILNDILDNGIPNSIHKHYGTITFKFKDGEEKTFVRGKGGNLVFRGDILPKPYSEMQNIIKYSLRYILVTGDQSITDVLNCCYKDKLPFYQIVPWKISFAKNLGKYLPQKYISSIKTSCGTMKAIKYEPHFDEFMKKFDFRINAKPKLDAVMYLCSTNDKDVYFLKKAYLSSKKKDAFIKKYHELISVYLASL
jgi:hypothetical protein